MAASDPKGPTSAREAGRQKGAPSPRVSKGRQRGSETWAAETRGSWKQGGENGWEEKKGVSRESPTSHVTAIPKREQCSAARTGKVRRIRGLRTMRGDLIAVWGRHGRSPTGMDEGGKGEMDELSDYFFLSG